MMLEKVKQLDIEIDRLSAGVLLKHSVYELCYVAHREDQRFDVVQHRALASFKATGHNGGGGSDIG